MNTRKLTSRQVSRLHSRTHAHTNTRALTHVLTHALTHTHIPTHTHMHTLKKLRKVILACNLCSAQFDGLIGSMHNITESLPTLDHSIHRTVRCREPVQLYM